MINEPKYASHEEIHASIEVWCQEASSLFMQLIDRMESIGERLSNLEARVREWEVGPR